MYSNLPDTMHSTEFGDEGSSLEHTPFDERAYDFVEETRSTKAQPDLLSTSGSTMPKGEDKGNEEELYVNERMDGDGEKSLITDESSDGDNEGMRTRQINEGADCATR